MLAMGHGRGGGGGYIERILKGVGVRTDGGGSCWPWGMGGGGGGGYIERILKGVGVRTDGGDHDGADAASTLSASQLGPRQLHSAHGQGFNPTPSAGLQHSSFNHCRIKLRRHRVQKTVS